MSRTTTYQGISEIENPESSVPPGMQRNTGAGRKPVTETSQGLLDDLNALIDPATRGDPESALRWTCKSLRSLSAELGERGHKISHQVVGSLEEKRIHREVQKCR